MRSPSSTRRRFGPAATIRRLVLAAVAIVLATSPSSAYWGNSFLTIPGITGDWKGAEYTGWIRVVSNYWQPTGMAAGGRGAGRGSCADDRKFRNCHSGPLAPRQGASALAIAVDKRSPVLPQLMDACRKGTPIGAMTFAEASARIRGAIELGPRPADIPEYFEYTLKNARLADCPVVADAPDQAFVVSFADITWLNYQGDAKGSPTTPVPVALGPAASSGATKAFVLEWFGFAHDVAEDQCPAINVKPEEKEYFALMPAEEAAKELAKLETTRSAGGTGAGARGLPMPNRGPRRLNAVALPGIVPDPGNAEPQTTLAFGVNLDGDEGTGSAPAGTCKHKNYVSPDGRTGIDNQLYTVMGCTAGYRGRKGKGFGNELMNAHRRDGVGNPSAMLVEITGIDDQQNDESVDVTILYSPDRMIKNVDGKKILSDYSFRVSNNPHYTSYFTRLRGRIVNGVVVTESVKSLRFNMDAFADINLFDGQMRLEFLPDGSMKGIVGGYQDWRQVMNTDPKLEGLWIYQAPGLYNAFKRAADGLKDPVTGECNGISSAFEIYGVPAYITRGTRTTTVSQLNVAK